MDSDLNSASARYLEGLVYDWLDEQNVATQREIFLVHVMFVSSCLCMYVCIRLCGQARTQLFTMIWYCSTWKLKETRHVEAHGCKDKNPQKDT